jgi:glutamate synthase (NADPH/NADH) small chain
VSEEKPEKKKLDPKRRSMPKQTPWERVKNFEEVALGYPVETAVEEASRCLQCKKPLCNQGCPVGIDIPGFIKCIVEGDFGAGVKKIKETNALPAICGRVCPQEEQCEKMCVVGKKGDPRRSGGWSGSSPTGKHAGKIEVPDMASKTGKKVAIVGPGRRDHRGQRPVILGHDVTVFEALHECGGVLMYGIPEFRLPKRIVNREVEYVKSLGVKIYTDFVVGKTRTVDQLLKEFDAIFVGSGAGLPWFMEIPGENLNGVFSANEYLTRVNLMKGFRFPEYDTPVKRPSRVAVVGGGNVAMDSARTAIRLGADEVHLVYRRSRTELPARIEEVENAEEEGVIFDLLTLPVRLVGDERGWIKEMECLRMELGEPDSSGRRKPIAVEGSNFIVPFDAAVIAIGNSPNPLIPMTTPGLEISKKGGIVTSAETGQTSRPDIWAGGDIVRGAATVISAMGDGRIAAASIHKYLMNKG